MRPIEPICPHCSMYACGPDPDDMCEGALRARLSEAEARAERMERALTLICDTSESNADRCIVEMKALASAALLPPPEPTWERKVCASCGCYGVEHSPNEICPITGGRTKAPRTGRR